MPPGELPPPPPRACFGRDELIEELVGLAKNFTPAALIGPGGIGKTFIALAVLHHDCIKSQFGDNRWFIRCDQFPSSHTHFLSRLSKVVGAGVENPEDLTPLRPFLSSREMILFLDNAESILDPQGTDAQEIYDTVEELSQFSNICLCITSRISTIPPACKSLDVPTLSKQAAHDTFYCIYKNDGLPDPVSIILEQLDFHPLSITLLATVALHNKWDTGRLTREWERQRTDVLHTHHHKSLAATIELSLASPMFQELGPNAQALLGVIAFFPQGINHDENNLEWLFPTLPNGTNVFDNFCVLSLTYRSNGFITMLAPLRDYLCPKDPASSPLLYAIKDCYFHRLSVNVSPSMPSVEEAQWIILEDVNVEHLLDVLTSVDPESTSVWDACADFMRHLYWHKRRLVMLGSKIEGLPDNHPSKPQCLFRLSWLFDSVGNTIESKRLLVYTLKLWRERGDDLQVAETLRLMSDVNRQLGLHEEGIQQGKEALEIYIRLDNKLGQARSWQWFAQSLYDDGQLGAAEKAISRSIHLLLDIDDWFTISACYCLLGDICHSKGETEKAIDNLKLALGVSSILNWQDSLYRTHYSLAQLYFSEGKFNDAHVHIEHAKSHVINVPYLLGGAMELQAGFWKDECMFEEARSEALDAIRVYEKIGAMKDVEDCKAILQDVEDRKSILQEIAEKMIQLAPGELNSNGQSLEIVPTPTPAYPPLSAQRAQHRPRRTPQQAAGPGSGQVPLA